MFLDQVKAFLEQEALEGTAVEQEVIRCAGLLIPLLLFADDILMPSHMFPILQRLAQTLGIFCDCNLLTDNLGKTEWIFRG